MYPLRLGSSALLTNRMRNVFAVYCMATKEKSSLILQKIPNLADGQCIEQVLRTLFSNICRTNIFGILAGNDSQDLMKPNVSVVSCNVPKRCELAAASIVPSSLIVSSTESKLTAELSELRWMVHNSIVSRTCWTAQGIY